VAKNLAYLGKVLTTVTGSLERSRLGQRIFAGLMAVAVLGVWALMPFVGCVSCQHRISAEGTCSASIRGAVLNEALRYLPLDVLPGECACSHAVASVPLIALPGA